MNYSYQDNGERGHLCQALERVVIKIGTQMLVNRNGHSPAEQVMALLTEVKALRERGTKVILVSSGAIGVGMQIMKVSRRPKNLAKLQAYAAIGQNHLMHYYNDAASSLGFNCAQLLVTAADLQDMERNQRVAQCLEALLEDDILPVINENDSVCTDEIKVGDNDTLAAYTAAMCRAGLTILFTTVDGLHETLPDGSLGQRLSVVHGLSPEILAMAKGTDGNQFSTGGMITKLRAANIVNQIGDYLIIAGDSSFSILEDIFAGRDIGTLFVPERKKHMHSRQRFLAFFSEPTGCLIVDEGARKALCCQNRSLLPGGVLGSRGVFHRGDTVRILSSDNKEIARGIVNYAFDEIAQICGLQTAAVAGQLGHQNRVPDVVHRDFLVLTADF